MSPEHALEGAGADSARPGSGPVVIAYDGSELARRGIEEAGRLLSPGRDALVVCVWQPFDVGFTPVDEVRFNAAQAPDVKTAAQHTAEAGAELAQDAGFRARGLEIEASPIWQGIVDVADEHDASVIVLGSHGRSGPARMLIGSVTAAVATHSRRTVLVSYLND